MPSLCRYAVSSLAAIADRVGKLGLDAELERKRLEKYDIEAEADIRQWMSNVAGKQVNGNFAEALRSGVVLCEYAFLSNYCRNISRLVNAIKPGTIKKINRMQQPFMMMVHCYARRFFTEPI